MRTANGGEPRPGEPVADSARAGNGFVPRPVQLSGFRGRVPILSTVPSLDTPTCDREARRWEQETQAIGGDIEMLPASNDLVFAQAPLVRAADVHHTTASAYMNEQFGFDYGVLLEENRLLGRAGLVIDRAGRVRQVEYVQELTTEPDYARAPVAAREVAG